MTLKWNWSEVDFTRITVARANVMFIYILNLYFIGQNFIFLYNTTWRRIFLIGGNIGKMHCLGHVDGRGRSWDFYVHRKPLWFKQGWEILVELMSGRRVLLFWRLRNWLFEGTGVLRPREADSEEPKYKWDWSGNENGRKCMETDCPMAWLSESQRVVASLAVVKLPWKLSHKRGFCWFSLRDHC